MTAEPKPTNMDRNSFLEWLWKIDREISRLGRKAYLDRSQAMVARYNCNYDPATAAADWLRNHLRRPR